MAERVSVMQAIRGMAKTFGIRVPRATSERYIQRALQALPEGLRKALAGLFGAVLAITEQIDGYDEMIEAAAHESYPIMLGQGSGVRSCAEPAEQRRRPLDVREQERHRSRGRWDCSGTRIARHEPTSVRQGGRQRRFCSKLPGVRRGGAVGGSSRLAVRIGLGPWTQGGSKATLPR